MKLTFSVDSSPQSPLFPINSYTTIHERGSRSVGTTQKRATKAPKSSTNIVINDGKLRLSLAIENILFVKAEHVYVSIYFINEQRVLLRGSLSGLLAQLPQEQFIQIHRSYIINLHHVDSWSCVGAFIAGEEIPISRSRRDEVVARLQRRQEESR